MSNAVASYFAYDDKPFVYGYSNAVGETHRMRRFLLSVAAMLGVTPMLFALIFALGYTIVQSQFLELNAMQGESIAGLVIGFAVYGVASILYMAARAGVHVNVHRGAHMAEVRASASPNFLLPPVGGVYGPVQPRDPRLPYVLMLLAVMGVLQIVNAVFWLPPGWTPPPGLPQDHLAWTYNFFGFLFANICLFLSFGFSVSIVLYLSNRWESEWISDRFKSILLFFELILLAAIGWTMIGIVLAHQEVI